MSNTDHIPSKIETSLAEENAVLTQAMSTEEKQFAKLLRKAIGETRKTEALVEIISKLQRALQECRDALEEAGNFHNPRFDDLKMRQVRVEALNALALVQKSGYRHDDQNPIQFDALVKGGRK